MSTVVKFRHEFKYFCSQSQIEIIKARMKGLINLDAHAGANGVYTIRSMYFDSYDNRCFYENESGTDPREKFRIRIYNASDEKITLECKRKERGKTLKTSCPITKEQLSMFVNKKNIPFSSDLPPLLRKFNTLIAAEHFQPAVIVEYDRTPFVCKQGNVRITLDENIRSSNQFEKFLEKDLFCRPIMEKGKQLLEVKYDEFLPDLISAGLEIDQLQYTAFSKYYLCRKYSVGGLL